MKWPLAFGIRTSHLHLCFRSGSSLNQSQSTSDQEKTSCPKLLSFAALCCGLSASGYFAGLYLNEGMQATLSVQPSRQDPAHSPISLHFCRTGATAKGSPASGPLFPPSKRLETEDNRLLFVLPLLKFQRFRILPLFSKDRQSRRLSCAQNEQGEPRSRKRLP